MKSQDDLLRKLKPILGDQAAALWLATKIDPGLRGDVESLLAIQAFDVGESFESAHPCFESPPPELASGPYRLGSCVYAGKDTCPFGLREDEWIQHVGHLRPQRFGKDEYRLRPFCSDSRSYHTDRNYR